MSPQEKAPEEKCRVLQLIVTLLGRATEQKSVLPAKMTHHLRFLMSMGSGMVMGVDGRPLLTRLQPVWAHLMRLPSSTHTLTHPHMYTQTRAQAHTHAHGCHECRWETSCTRSPLSDTPPRAGSGLLLQRQRDTPDTHCTEGGAAKWRVAPCLLSGRPELSCEGGTSTDKSMKQQAGGGPLEGKGAQRRFNRGCQLEVVAKAVSVTNASEAGAWRQGDSGWA